MLEGLFCATMERWQAVEERQWNTDDANQTDWNKD